VQSAASSWKLARPSWVSRSRSTAMCSGTEACRCQVAPGDRGVGLGRNTAAGQLGEPLAHPPSMTSGNSPAYRGSREYEARIAAQRGRLQLHEQRVDLLCGAVMQQPANSRSRAPAAPGLDVSTSARGSSRAALRSSRVAAITRNSVSSSSRRPRRRRRAPVCAMKSSVTGAGHLGDVQLVPGDQLQEQVRNGPLKFSSRTVKRISPARSGAAPALGARSGVDDKAHLAPPRGRSLRGPAGGRPARPPSSAPTG